MYSLQLSPSLAGGLKPSWISANLEADLAANLCSRPCTIQAGAPGDNEEHYLFYFWSCKHLESRFKVCIDALCAKRRKGATTANPEVGSR